MRAGKCCFLPEILHPAFLKSLFQYVCLRIWFITYLQPFFPAEKIKMNIPDNPIHLTNKIIPVMDQLTAIGNQLHIVNIQHLLIFRPEGNLF